MAFPWRKKNKEGKKEEEPIPRRILEIRVEGPDPDTDLGEDAGFEVGVEKTPQPGIFGKFKPQDRSFTVAAVDGSPSKASGITTAIGSDDGMTYGDEEGAHFGEGACDETKSDTNEQSSTMKRLFPLAILVCFVLAVALLVGLLVGLNNDKDTNKMGSGARNPIINVLLEFDDNPEEVSWSIMDKTSWKIVGTSPADGYNTNSTFINEEVMLEWNNDYVFRISDSGADGLSSSTNGGKWLLVYKGTELVSGSGNWGSEDAVTFEMSEQAGRPVLVG